MPLPSTQVMLSCASSVLWASPTPSAPASLAILLGDPLFMRNPPDTRHPILHRIAQRFSLSLVSPLVTGFTIFGRLATINLRNDA